MPLGTLDRTPPPFFRQGTPALTKLVQFEAVVLQQRQQHGQQAKRYCRQQEQYAGTEYGGGIADAADAVRDADAPR